VSSGRSRGGLGARLTGAGRGRSISGAEEEDYAATAALVGGGGRGGGFAGKRGKRSTSRAALAGGTGYGGGAISFNPPIIGPFF